MKKRILSLAMAACLALSMMLTLSACGKKNLEEYFNTDTMQKLVTSSVEQYESQGMELKMYAEGDELHQSLSKEYLLIQMKNIFLSYEIAC